MKLIYKKNTKKNNKEEEEEIRNGIYPLTNDLPIIAINYGQNHPDDPAIFIVRQRHCLHHLLILVRVVKYGYNVIYYSMSADDLQFVVIYIQKRLMY